MLLLLCILLPSYFYKYISLSTYTHTNLQYLMSVLQFLLAVFLSIVTFTHEKYFSGFSEVSV